MFRYYFTLGLRSLRRNPALTALMVLTLAIGVAASISTLTILHVMSGNPNPAKSARLLVPLLDVAPAKTYVPGFREEYAVQNTYRDSVNMLQGGPGVRRTVLYDVNGSIEPARREEPLIDVQGISTTADFFPMFDVPFRYGGAWSAADDARGARVIVFSRKKAEAVFGATDPVGKRVRLFNNEFTVAGVLDDWNPVPRYPHLVNGSGGFFQGEDEIYVPFRTTIDLELRSNGNTSCSHSSGPGFKGLIESECTWIQVWFELASALERPALQAWLDAYARDQQRGGRLERHAPNHLYDVMEWMETLKVVRADNKLAVWLSLGFLLLCIVNTMGLLLAKFSTRAAEVGVRRALGAARSAIFRQFLVETGVVGLAGGVLGLVLAFASLWLIRQQSRDLSALAQMDWQMLAGTFAIAVTASLVAGLLPTWRACQVAPAVQLKSQ
jgi:putative ABC transport system permease protein